MNAQMDQQPENVYSEADERLTEAKIIKIQEMIQQYTQAIFRTEQIVLVGAFATASFILLNTENIQANELGTIVAFIPFTLIAFGTIRSITLWFFVNQLMELNERFSGLVFPNAPTAESALKDKYKSTTRGIAVASAALSVISLGVAFWFGLSVREALG